MARRASCGKAGVTVGIVTDPTKFVFSYEHAPVLRQFSRSNAFIRGLMGPVGAGKSSACVVELLRRGMAQKPGLDGVARSRWAIIRNTYSELRNTTIKTVLAWLPPVTFGDYRENPTPQFIIRGFKGVEIELLFLALDSEKDVKKLLSLELTGAWINEAREVPWSIIEVLQGRIGRYPSMRDGGPTWRGLIMDTNPPDADSRWYRFFEEEDHSEGVAELAKYIPGITVENYAAIFKQPSGLSAEAENLPYLEAGYYQRQAIGKSKEWVNVYLRGQYGFVMEGLPVFPEFQDALHVTGDVRTDRDTPVIRGWDYGLTPSCIFSQLTPKGQLITVDEMVSENMGIARFAEAVVMHSKLAFPKRNFIDVGDPAGDARSQTDERTCFEIQRAMDIDIQPAPQTLNIRLESMRKPLNSLRGGQPGFLLHERCKTLRRAFLGGYHYKKMGKVDGEWQSLPNKNRFSHPMDAQTYIAAYLFGDSLTTLPDRRGRDDDEWVFTTDPTRSSVTGY